MMRAFSILLILLLAACGGGDSDSPATTQTTFLVSGPEEDPRQPIVVRNFGIDAETVRRGQPIQVRIELAQARPAQQISVDWYGPDGWLVAYQTRAAAEARFDVTAPVRPLDQPGRYRVVLRVGSRPLAEDSVTVTE